MTKYLFEDARTIYEAFARGKRVSGNYLENIADNAQMEPVQADKQAIYVRTSSNEKWVGLIWYMLDTLWMWTDQTFDHSDAFSNNFIYDKPYNNHVYI